MQKVLQLKRTPQTYSFINPNRIGYEDDDFLFDIHRYHKDMGHQFYYSEVLERPILKQQGRVAFYLLAPMIPEEEESEERKLCANCKSRISCDHKSDKPIKCSDHIRDSEVVK